MTQHDQALETLCFRLTQHCNLSCGFCRAGSSPRTRQYADIPPFLSFVAAAQRELGLRHVSISGGEPLIDPRLSDVVQQLLAAGFFVTVTTNGTLRAAEKLGPVFQMFPECLRVRVSLDGLRGAHDAVRGRGTFERAVGEVGNLKDSTGWVGINTVVRSEIRTQAFGMAQLMRGLGVDEWALITPVPQGSAAGMTWASSETLPLLKQFSSDALAAGYGGRIVTWNFIETPNTSVLVKTNGDIVLAGISDLDDERIGTTYAFQLDAVREALNVRATKGKTHFSWRPWQ